MRVVKRGNFSITERFFSVSEVPKDPIIAQTVPELVKEFCQFLENPLNGSEGLVASETGKLRAVLIIFRHGER